MFTEFIYAHQNLCMLQEAQNSCNMKSNIFAYTHNCDVSNQKSRNSKQFCIPHHIFWPNKNHSRQDFATLMHRGTMVVACFLVDSTNKPPATLRRIVLPPVGRAPSPVRSVGAHNSTEMDWNKTPTNPFRRPVLSLGTNAFSGRYLLGRVMAETLKHHQTFSWMFKKCVPFFKIGFINGAMSPL